VAKSQKKPKEAEAASSAAQARTGAPPVTPEQFVLQWVSWPVLEAELYERKIVYKIIESVLDTQIDHKRSISNRARLGGKAILEEVQHRLTQAALRIHRLVLPPLVAWRPDGPDGPFVLLDGNNRRHWLKWVGIRAYNVLELIGIGQETADEVMYLCNTLGGATADTDTMIAHAISQYRERHPGDPTYTIEVAALNNGLDPDLLQSRLHADDLRIRLETGDLNNPTAAKWDTDTLVRMIPLRGVNVIALRTVFNGLAGRVPQSAITGVWVKDLARKLLKPKVNTEAHLIDVAKKEVYYLAKKAGMKRQQVRLDRAHTIIVMAKGLTTKLAEVFDKADPRDVFRDPDARDAFLAQVDELTRRLGDVAAKLPTPDPARDQSAADGELDLSEDEDNDT
jgi:hypothetical protein